MLAILWSLLTRQVLGVPHDLASKARRYGGAAQSDIEALARIHAERYIYYWRRGSVFFVAFMAFLITALLILAFVFRFEFAQAVFLLIIPILIMNALQLRAAQLVLAGHGLGEALHEVMHSLRIAVQVTGFIFIVLTVFIGVFHVLAAFQYGG